MVFVKDATLTSRWRDLKPCPMLLVASPASVKLRESESQPRTRFTTRRKMDRRNFLAGLALLPLFGRRRCWPTVPQTPQLAVPKRPTPADKIPPGFEENASWQVEEKGLLRRHALFANKDKTVWRIYVDGRFVREFTETRLPILPRLHRQ